MYCCGTRDKIEKKKKSISNYDSIAHNFLLTDDPICNVENCGTIPYGTAVESLLIIIETPRG
jgi:hypothetical protein